MRGNEGKVVDELRSGDTDHDCPSNANANAITAQSSPRTNGGENNWFHDEILSS